jgi:hypothetical protein
VPSHVLSSGAKTRIRRRVRRRASLRRLRDWRTWGPVLACIIGLSLSEEIVSRLWPQAHGAGHVMAVIVAGAVLGATGVLLVAGLVILAGAVRDRTLG